MGSLACGLFGKTRVNVLAALFGQPGQRLYLRELVRAAGGGVGAVQRELARLTEAGIVLRTARGNQVYYEPNRACPIFDELVSLIAKTTGLAGIVRAALLPLSSQIDAAFIYGSAARGELRAASDIDLLVVGGVSLFAVVKAIAPVQSQLGREVNPIVYPTEEFQRKMADGHHFLTSVVGATKVYVLGGERELAGLAEERLVDRATAEPPGD